MSDDGRVARTAVSYILLFTLIFGLAGTVDHNEFRKQFKEKRAIALGFFGQFVMLPFLGFCAVKAFDLTSLGSGENRGIEAVILLLTTSSPGGSYSNWWCFLFNADLALSVAMTTVSSIASVVMLPLNLAIYLNATNSTAVDIEYGPLAIAVVIVVCGIGLGLFASSKLESKRHVFHTVANVAGLSLIVLGFASTSGSRDGLFAQPWRFFVGCASPCVFGIVLSTIASTLAGLTKPQVVSVGIETVYQNTALALSVALASPAPARAAAVPVFYQAVQIVTLFFYSITTWKLGWTFAPADVAIWRMLSTNYQPVFQKDTALVAEELRIAKKNLREAEVEAEALGLRPKTFSVRKSQKSPSHSRSPSRGVSLKGGTAFAGLFRGQSVPVVQPRDGKSGELARGASNATPEKSNALASPKHRRTQSTPDGFGLGLGLGEIEHEAAAAVGLKDSMSNTISFAGTPDAGDLEKGESNEIADFVTPLKLRVKALEELNIRLARQSTRPASYRDFANVIQGTASSAGNAIVSGGKALVAAVRMSRIGSFISTAGSSPGGSVRGSRANSVAGSVPATPRTPVAPPKGGKLNKVAPEPE